MFAAITSFLGTVTSNLPGIIIVCLLSFMGYLFHKAGKLDWTDLITARGPDNKVSLTKFLQLVGGVIGSWAVIHTVLHDKLTYDILMVYLAYVASIEGFSKFVAAKYGASNGNNNGVNYGVNYGVNSTMRGLPTTPPLLSVTATQTYTSVPTSTPSPHVDSVLP